MKIPTDTPSSLEPLIFSIRRHRVILDSDLARLYGVTTKALNQALKRNNERFPSDFAFQLIDEEMEQLRLTLLLPESPRNGEIDVKTNWSQFVTSSPEDRPAPESRFAAEASLHRGMKYLP